MRTAEELIRILKELPADEWRNVVEYVDSSRDDRIEPTHDSNEDMAKIESDLEEARRGINVSGPFFSAKEAIEHLDRLTSTL